MKRSRRIRFLFIAFLAQPVVLCRADSHAAGTDNVYFNTTVKDPYRWLENKQSPKVKRWVEDQDKAAVQYLLQLPGRNKITERFRQLLYADRTGLPQQAGGRLFYERKTAGQEKSALFWRDEPLGSQHILIDPNDWRSDTLGEWIPSPDGKQLIYLVKKNNSDEAVLHVRDVLTGRDRLTDTIAGANFADPSWGADSIGFYYIRLPPKAFGSLPERVANAEVRLHRLGDDPSMDAVIYPKTADPSLYLSPSVSRDGRYLFVSVQNGWSNNSLFVEDLKSDTTGFQALFVSTSAMASVVEWNDTFYLQTNDQASNHRVVKIPVGQREGTILIPERADTTIEEMRLVGHRLILLTLHDAANRLEIWSLDGRLERRVDLPALGSIDEFSGREDSPSLYYEFQNFTTPPQIWSISVDSGAESLWATSHVPVESRNFQLSQRWYPSKDGTRISMFVVEPAGAASSGGSCPYLLEGYGGFNEPIVPRFDAFLFPWLEAGGCFAIPNLRGGGEYGEAWHQAGMRTQKQNTFDDFIAAAQYLIRERKTTARQLVIRGNSNGGLLVSAALTQKPDLFRAAVCGVPLTDMVRYPLYGEGAAWISEYGSPKIENEFRALYAYSPYHHVRAGTSYPAVLFMSSENDDRVDPMHARKMAAALQAATAQKTPFSCAPAAMPVMPAAVGPIRDWTTGRMNSSF